MLPTTIALSVDETNDSNPVEHTYTYFKDGVYYDSDHTVASRNQCQFGTTPAKASGNFYGVLRTRCKFTTDISVAGINGEDIKVPLIGEAVFSLPVGTTPEQMMILRQKLVAMLDYDTVMVPHQTQGQY